MSVTERLAIRTAHAAALVGRFGAALDRRDWDGAVRCLVDPVKWDYEELNGRPAASVAAAELADGWARGLGRTDHASHLIGLGALLAHTEEGEEEQVYVAPAQITVAFDGDSWVVRGSYEFLLGSNGGPIDRIHGVKLHVVQKEGNPELIRIAAESGA